MAECCKWMECGSTARGQQVATRKHCKGWYGSWVVLQRPHLKAAALRRDDLEGLTLATLWLQWQIKDHTALMSHGKETLIVH